MKKLAGPLCAFLVVCAQGVRAEVDSNAVYGSLRNLKEVAENESIDRKAMSYSEQAIVKSIRQPDFRMKVVGLMLELSDELSQEQAVKTSGSPQPFKSLFGKSASEAAAAVVDPDLSEDTRVAAVKLLEQMALRFDFVESVPAVAREFTTVAEAAKNANAFIRKQRKLRFYNYNDGGRGPAKLKE